MRSLIGLLACAALTACGATPAATSPDGAISQPDGATSNPDSAPDGGSPDVSSTAPIIAPPPTGAPIQATAIAVGHNRHACAILADETVACWGQNTFGELGDASSRLLQRAGASAVPGLSGVRQLGIGTGSFCGASGTCWVSEPTCALQKDGVAKCWGPGLYGQLGNGKEGAEYFEDAPVTVGLSEIADLSVGSDAACAATKAGEVWCWGRNDRGELGFLSPPCGPFHQFKTDTQPPPQPVACASSPHRVPGLTGVGRVAVANGRQCALHTDGHVSCWGSARLGGPFGGVSTGGGVAAVPKTVDGVTAVDIALADTFSCASRADGFGVCWDGVFGVLKPLANVSGLRRLRGFKNDAIGFETDGTIKQWSSNAASPGFADARDLDKGALDLSLNEIQSCVVRADRGVRCWKETIGTRAETEAAVLAQSP